MKVKNFMREIHTIECDKTFFEVLKFMVGKRINSVFVVDGSGKVCGLVNTRQLLDEAVPEYLDKDLIAAHFAGEGIFEEDIKRVKNSPIKKFMKTDITVVKEEDTLMKVATLALREGGQSRFPVVNNDFEPVGLITRTELKIFMGKILGIE